MLYADCDNPEKACNKMRSAKPVDLEYAIGGGDSGGPLFSYKNNALFLVGIAAYGQKSFQGY